MYDAMYLYSLTGTELATTFDKAGIAAKKHSQLVWSVMTLRLSVRVINIIHHAPTGPNPRDV